LRRLAELKMMPRIAHAMLLLVIFLAGIAAFNGWHPLTPRISTHRLEAFQQDDSERLKELGRIIEQEIGTPTANESSQCKLIAFGSKPCGGPARYLVYSTEKTDESRLKRLVNEFNGLAKKINEERKMMSDCMLVTEPKVEFVDKVCKIPGR
jgi:hypothetical protein